MFRDLQNWILKQLLNYMIIARPTQVDEALNQVDVRPHLDQCVLLGFYSLQVLHGSQFVGALVQGDGLLVVDDLKGVVED